VIGAKEVESAKLTPRSRSDIGSENETISTDDFLDNLSEAIKERK
jgi:threonyl-tRNA synthetase